jgi:hypothetical protein
VLDLRRLREGNDAPAAAAAAAGDAAELEPAAILSASVSRGVGGSDNPVLRGETSTRPSGLEAPLPDAAVDDDDDEVAAADALTASSSFARAITTDVSALRLLLMALASSSRMPVAPDRFTISEPARSAITSSEAVTLPVSLSACVTLTISSAWLRLDTAFMLVAEVER